MTLFPAVMAALKAKGADDVLVFGGGIVPDEDVIELKKLGVAEIFKPGAPTTQIIEWVETHVRPRAEASRG
jgi:methylmalonyl-CoA mutase C-terminal domain/subunit